MPSQDIRQGANYETCFISFAHLTECFFAD